MPPAWRADGLVDKVADAEAVAVGFRVLPRFAAQVRGEEVEDVVTDVESTRRRDCLVPHPALDVGVVVPVQELPVREGGPKFGG